MSIYIIVAFFPVIFIITANVLLFPEIEKKYEDDLQ